MSCSRGKPRQRRYLTAGAIGVCGLVMAACGGSSSHAGNAAAESGTSKGTPSRTFPAPAGLTDLAPPQPNGITWLLAKTSAAANIQSLDLSTGKISGVVPVSSTASAITELSTGVVALGTASGNAGSLELRNGSTGSLTATVPVSGPVISVAPGASGSTVYVLEGTSTAEAVEVVDVSSDKVTGTIPVSLGTVAVTSSPDGTEIYALQNTGSIAVLNTAGGKPTGLFSAGHSGRAIAISPGGSTLYVLKGQATVRNVAVVHLNTESVKSVLPAPADAVAIQVAVDGNALYDAVGTPAVGNVQAFSLVGG